MYTAQGRHDNSATLKQYSPLVRRLDGELQMEVRLQVLKALQATGGEEALRALLAAFLDSSARFRDLRLTAYDGVRTLSGKSYGVDQLEQWQHFFAERFPAPPASPSEAPPAGHPAPPVGASSGAPTREGR